MKRLKPKLVDVGGGMKQLRTFATVVSIAACTLLSSCWKTLALSSGHKVESSEEVANVYVSAYPAVPWSSIAEKLEPKHNLSTADARALAAVTTQSQVSQVLSTLAAGLAIGLPGRTNATTVLRNADGSTTTTGTKKLEPGSTPSTSGSSAVALTDENLVPELQKNPFANGVDASTQLMVGSGVYQLAQILDNQITKALPLKGYQAHLVTFQVNLQPLRRDLPYDAYVNITLIPGAWQKAITSTTELQSNANELSPVIVYPLIVADAMESSSVGKSVESIRQAAFALSGVVQNVGVSAGASRGLDELEARLGSDRNTLVTVGRISDHTLRIRIGAQQQGSQKLALVPRTQNVSVVVFTRAAERVEKYIDRLAVITETTFVDAESGEVLESKRAHQARSGDDVDKVVSLYGFELNKNCSNDESRPADLLRAVDRSDFGYVSSCLQETVAEATSQALQRSDRPSASTREREAAPPLFMGSQSATSSSSAPSSATLHPQGAAPANSSPKTLYELSRVPPEVSAPPPAAAESSASSAGLTPLAESRLRRVIAKLMTLQSDSRFSKLMVALKPYKKLETTPPPQNRAVFLTDDKATSKVVLRGGKDLSADDISSWLEVAQVGSESVNLVPTLVEVDSSGSTVTLTFPSLETSKLLLKPTAPAGAPKGHPAPTPLVTLHWAFPDETNKKQIVYPVRLLTGDAPSSGSPVSVSSSVLIADAMGTAKLTIVVGEWDAKTKGALGLRLNGADVRAVEPAVAFDATRNAIPLSPSSVVTLTLGNVSSAQVVQLRTIANKSPIGTVITLPVEPLRVSSN